ncbi:MAG: metallophosphoesterase [Gammaproteobacteria bacterium]|nr:metallophosphoesterase [Gammaproteobacteria bacterium]
MNLRFVAVCALLVAAPARADFEFVALGDTAYNGEKDYPPYEALIDLINDTAPAFSIHVGDIWGAGTCEDWHLQVVARFFERYQQPVVYTPGDNEWVDCDNPGMGGFDPMERLDKLREVFFADAASLGAKPMALVRQGDLSEAHGKLVENARWQRDNVLFVTAHVPGSRNNANHHSLAALQEFALRNAGNVAWLNDSFRLAAEGEMAAVVITIHAELFDSDPYVLGPYGDTIRAIREGAARFARPVLLIHGDFHKFVIDRPFLVVHGEEELPDHANITRLQVYGAPEIRAVKVTVQPETAWVFGFQPLFVE